MNTRLYILTFFISISYLGYAQNAVLCPIQEIYLRIEDPVNIPVITDNGDGTITLTHTESYVTELFSNYVNY